MLSCKEVIEEHGASGDDFGVDIVYMQLLREDPVLEVPVPDTAFRKNPEDAEHVLWVVPAMKPIAFDMR